MERNPTTLGELRASGWRHRSVKEELRQNLEQRLRSGDELFPDVIGYGDTVVPSIERAILAGHDLILLGERGQAKTRIIRRLVELLDEEMPVVAGCEINDDPFGPICADCREQLGRLGDDLPVAWLPRDRRYGEKLATPDTSVADLIGDVDPIKVAEGRYLGDELTIHYGLVPRTHRGIFSVNELPDLPARIQVALLNVLEERDIQIRGYHVRLPLDVLLIASANPEDYTNRGKIITPLKDRFGAEVRTHYPLRVGEEIQIMDQEAGAPHASVPLTVPEFMKEVLAEFTHQVRNSSHVNQRSGVSVRFSIANVETLGASAIRRALRTGEPEAVARVSDLPALVPSSLGKVEFEVFEEGREVEILERLLSAAVLEVYRERLLGVDLADVVERFEAGLEVDSGDLVTAAELLGQLGEVSNLHEILGRLDIDAESPAQAAAALEFVLEGLHLTRRLNKRPTVAGSRYGGG